MFYPQPTAQRQKAPFLFFSREGKIFSSGGKWFYPSVSIPSSAVQNVWISDTPNRHAEEKNHTKHCGNEEKVVPLHRILHKT